MNQQCLSESALPKQYSCSALCLKWQEDKLAEAKELAKTKQYKRKRYRYNIVLRFR